MVVIFFRVAEEESYLSLFVVPYNSKDLLGRNDSKARWIRKDFFERVCVEDLPVSRPVAKERPPVLFLRDSCLPFTVWINERWEPVIETGGGRLTTCFINGSVTSYSSELLVLSQNVAQNAEVPIHIGTDGSAIRSERCAGWGCVILGWDMLPRILCGPVIVATFADKYVGARECTNNAGELCALYYALVWISITRPMKRIVLYYDSQVAVNELFFPTSESSLAELAWRAKWILEEVNLLTSIQFVNRNQGTLRQFRQ